MKAWKDLSYLLELQLRRRSMIVRVIIVLNWTVFVDSDWRFDNLCGSHLHWSQGELYHVSSMLLLLIKWLLGRNLSQFIPSYLCNLGLFDIFLSVHPLAFFDWSRSFLSEVEQSWSNTAPSLAVILGLVFIYWDDLTRDIPNSIYSNS